MYIYNKEDLNEHPMFKQAVILSELTTNSQWLSLYRDRDGELAINFADRLTEAQVKTILMHFKDLLDGDTNVEAISCEYHKDYQYTASHFNKEVKNYTQVYTPDGYDYSQF